MQLKALWDGRKNASDVLQKLPGDPRVNRVMVEAFLCLGCRSRIDTPAPFLLKTLHLIILRLKPTPYLIMPGLNLLSAHDASFNQLIGVEPPEGFPLRDLPIDMRLSKGRLICFVVTLAAVTIHVDYDISAELLAEGERKFCSPDQFHGALSVNVQNRSFNHLGHIGGIGRGPSIRRHGREPYLIIDNDMNCSSRPISRKLRKVENLSN